VDAPWSGAVEFGVAASGALVLGEPCVVGELCPGWVVPEAVPAFGEEGSVVLGFEVCESVPVGLLWVCPGAEPEGVVLSGLVL